ncbi:MAG: QueT transporter family protein [Ruminococcaceae bacterium]|nr:QueT transporter family protein [Oscillospiraceae bacterium]
MKRTNTQLGRIRYLCYAAMIAAVYTVLTYVIGSFGLANGVIQLRLSEALCILPVFLPAAIPGLTVGCFLSNLLLACPWQDVVFGALATLLGAIGTRLLKKFPLLSPLPAVLSNTLIIPFVLAFVYHAEEGLPFLFLSVGLGELLSAYICGILLWSVLKKHADRLFPTRKK